MAGVELRCDASDGWSSLGRVGGAGAGGGRVRDVSKGGTNLRGKIGERGRGEDRRGREGGVGILEIIKPNP